MSTRTFWEDLYGQREQVWSGRANPLLVREVQDLAPGRALDLGCGEGGDAVWLAERGWRVTGVDIAQTALDRAAAEVARRGLEVDLQGVDLAQGLPAGPYALVSAQFLQSPVELPRERVLREAARALAPGGVLLVVGHVTGPPWSEHRPDPELMPAAAEVVRRVALDEQGWVLERAEDVARSVTGPEGQQAEVLDSLVRWRRR